MVKTLLSACFWFRKELQALCQERGKDAVCKWKHFPYFPPSKFLKFGRYLQSPTPYIQPEQGTRPEGSISFLSSISTFNLAKPQPGWNILNSPVLKIILHSSVPPASLLSPISGLMHKKDVAVGWCRISKAIEIDTIGISRPEFITASIV